MPAKLIKLMLSVIVIAIITAFCFSGCAGSGTSVTAMSTPAETVHYGYAGSLPGKCTSCE